jgi:hypothetical protein
MNQEGKPEITQISGKQKIASNVHDRGDFLPTVAYRQRPPTMARPRRPFLQPCASRFSNTSALSVAGYRRPAALAINRVRRRSASAMVTAPLVKCFSAALHELPRLVPSGFGLTDQRGEQLSTLTKPQIIMRGRSLAQSVFLQNVPEP